MFGIMFTNNIMGKLMTENGKPETKSLYFPLLFSHIYSSYVSTVLPITYIKVNIMLLGHIEGNSLYKKLKK